MNKPCHRCQKTVYPTEKLSCLDKTWHKGCFNCETCGLKLSMKTYKGYAKLPYCVAHYPTTKFTAVVDTPEGRRLAQNTQNQSQITYHKDHEKDKGSLISVVDDPESQRVKKSQNQTSHIAYKATAPPPKDLSYIPAEAGGSARNSQVLTTQISQERKAPVSIPVQPAAAAAQPKYGALYDYTAADDDEISLQEGDTIVNVETIDEGWMTGLNTRTNQHGMLPSNYVQPL